MELIVEYVLPNIVMFGGLYAVAKFVEYATWAQIELHTNGEKENV